LKGILPLFLTGMWETMTERSSLSVSTIGRILSSTDTEMDQLSVFAEYCISLGLESGASASMFMS
jgi:hypothetical protein